MPNMPQYATRRLVISLLASLAEDVPDFPAKETFFVSADPRLAVHYSHRLALFLVVSTSLTVEHKNVFRRDCLAGHQSAILLVQVKVRALVILRSQRRRAKTFLTKISLLQTHHQRTKFLPQ
jgi:hypothetical protein